MKISRTKLKRLDLEAQLRNLLERVDSGELGYHDQIVRVPKILQDHGIPNDVILEHEKRARDLVGRRYATDRELADGINWESTSPRVEGSSRKGPSKNAEPNQMAMDTWADRGSLNQLLSFSDPVPETAQEILRGMYEPEDYLFIHETLGHGPILTCEEWCSKDLDKMQFICQSILRDPDGGRNNDNVLETRYVVFETDELPKDWNGQAGLITRLSQELGLPKVIVATSNKSLHAHWDVRGIRKDKIQKWFNLAITLFGDAQLLTVPCQLVRLAYGTNQKTNLQQKPIFWKND